ncbi:hypothetical protein DIURU_001784 [Diutina rugosa]|uniref:Transcription factor n=1 Tax=Diutina rugosa TaxID=5481 RepID=A0A642USU2_DIURU|nr:uncharacterized protein DIURU_001784 [Diutina rugosa]KAA8904948.1 hypothetical protein DIURU_001784 [Diutina rugosa]
MSDASDAVCERLRLIEDLKFFLATAPANWQENQVIRRYYLNSDEGFVSCVYWNNLYFITGTDIVRSIVYKFEHFGRKIVDRKKFEEGIFSDLRNLKCGTDAILELPRSEFLEFLFKNSCLRTQKKQKVFFWFNVPHDKLMADALERDLKKEKLGHPPTTVAHAEPALSFEYDESKSLFSQLNSHMSHQQLLKGVATTEEDAVEAIASSGDPAIKAEFQPTLPGASTPPPPRPENANANDNDGDEDDDDDDEDFPLDFIHPYDHDQVITLDANQHVAYGSLVDDTDYDSFVDTSVFTQIPSSNGSIVSQPVAYTDEYLIEQAQPLKPFHTSRADDTYLIPPQPSSSASYAPQPPYYVPMSTPGGQRYPPPPPPPSVPTAAGPPSSQYYGGTAAYYSVPEPAYMAHEQEYWPPQPGYEYPPGGYSYPVDEYPGAGYSGATGGGPPTTYYPRPHPGYTKKRAPPPSSRVVVGGGVSKPPHNTHHRRPPSAEVAAAAAAAAAEATRPGPKPE